MTKFLFVVFLFLTSRLLGQNPDPYKSVRAPIDRLFLGMAHGDSALVHSAFANQVTMVTILNEETGKSKIRFENSINGFLKTVGTPHLESFNEPIWDLKISVDGDFAQAWANYAFFAGKKFSHCGVDAFHLVRGTEGQWSIFHLTDTRQKVGCNIPENIKNQFK
jgi:hypothetical protein